MKYCTAVFLVVLSFVLTTCGHADSAHWSIWFTAGHNYGGSSLYVGTDGSMSDGFDQTYDRQAVSGYGKYVATYHDGGDWTGPSGFYYSDYRAPITLVPGQCKTWTLYLWADATQPNNDSFVGLEWDVGSPRPEFLFVLTLRSKPQGVLGGPSEGTAWNLSASPYGYGSVSLPTFSTNNGLDGYVFDFTATVIPEPSCIAALGLGLSGLGVGLVRRRRR